MGRVWEDSPRIPEHSAFPIFSVEPASTALVSPRNVNNTSVPITRELPFNLIFPPLDIPYFFSLCGVKYKERSKQASSVIPYFSGIFMS
jgi:hypothetical protein